VTPEHGALHAASKAPVVHASRRRAPVAKVALFPGDSELQQLLHIFKLLGTPSEDEWPGVTKLRDWHEFPNWAPQDLAQARAPAEPRPRRPPSPSHTLRPDSGSDGRGARGALIWHLLAPCLRLASSKASSAWKLCARSPRRQAHARDAGVPHAGAGGRAPHVAHVRVRPGQAHLGARPAPCCVLPASPPPTPLVMHVRGTEARTVASVGAQLWCLPPASTGAMPAQLSTQAQHEPPPPPGLPAHPTC